MAYNPYWNSYNTNDVQQSQYNAGVLKIARLNDSWMRCRTLWRNGDLLNLNFELDYIWLEFEADSTPDQQKTINEYNESICKINNQLYIEKNLLARRKLLSELSKVLKVKWMFLFRVEKAQGLGKKYKDEDADLF